MAQENSPLSNPNTSSSNFSVQLPLNLTVASQDISLKSTQFDASVSAASNSSNISWPTRYFGGAEVPIGIDQSPEQLIQQQMLNQSRTLMMQSMAVRDITSAESDINKNYASNNSFTVHVRSRFLLCVTAQSS
ncbi:hypothetical protein BGZ76_000782 [Entomortierella beljakovae]|nr:hypothetical protein BGZ76_000782 [Entomortierella beljakovae]